MAGGFYLTYGAWLGPKVVEAAWLGAKIWRAPLMLRSVKLGLASMHIVAAGGAAALNTPELRRTAFDQTAAVEQGGGVAVAKLRSEQAAMMETADVRQGGGGAVAQVTIRRTYYRADAAVLQGGGTVLRRVRTAPGMGLDGEATVAAGGQGRVTRVRDTELSGVPPSEWEILTGGGGEAQLVARREISMAGEAAVETGGGAEAQVVTARELLVDAAGSVETGAGVSLTRIRRAALGLRQSADVFTGGGAALALWYFPNFVEPGVLRKRQAKAAALSDGVLRLT